MPHSNKTCYLFTQSFPFGDGEVFVEKEIPFLASYFKEVIIFPLTLESKEQKPLPPNVSFNFLFGANASPFNSTATFKRNFFLFFGIMLKEFLSHPARTLSQGRTLASDLLQQIYRAELFSEAVQNKEGNTVALYSYWFDRWATILTLVKKTNAQLPFEFVSRAHGYEIFKEQTKFGYHPFKKLMLSGAKKIYTVSKQGMRYLSASFPAFTSKINYSYLGSSDGALTEADKNVFHILSCAHVREVKRLDKVCEILACMPGDTKLKWTLIGDGKDLALVKQKASRLPENIECSFTGNLTAQEIMKFYLETPVNLFLSVSRSEGLPYTMIEAISFGIPLMSTNVGGCNEIVTERTGVLIEKDFDPQVVAKEIIAFKNSDKNKVEFRKGVRKFWEENFDAATNYFKFYETAFA